MNKQKYEKMPSDLRMIFDGLCGEFKERTALMWNREDFGGLAFAAKEGVEIIELSDEEMAKWTAAAKPVVENYVKSMVKDGYPEKELREWISFLVSGSTTGRINRFKIVLCLQPVPRL